MSSSRPRVEREEALGAPVAGPAEGSAAGSAFVEATDIHELILDSTTLMFVQMFLALLAGAVVLTLLRSLGITADPDHSFIEQEMASEGYTIRDMWHDARFFIHFLLGVLLCLVLQGKQAGTNSSSPDSDGFGDSVAEPQKGGVYTWLLW